MSKAKVKSMLVLGMLPLLGACGNGEDFAVTSSTSPAQIVGALTQFDFASEASYLPNLAITIERPAQNVVLYTIPAREIPDKQTGESTIRLTIEPGEEGQGAIIRAAVDVPAVRVLMGEAGKELSEEKVEAELKKSLERFRPGEIRQLLVAVAVASNVDFQSAANTAMLPSGAASRFGQTDEVEDDFASSDAAGLDQTGFDEDPDGGGWGASQ
jgi:hypothetical protein